MKHLKNFRRLSLTVLLFSIAFSSASLFAAIRTWSGAGGDSLWNNGLNWGGTPPAVTGDNLVFAGTVQLFNTNDIVNMTNNWVRFDAGGFNLFGNKIIVNNGFTNLADGNTISLPLEWTLTGTKNWQVATNTTLTLAGTVLIPGTANFTVMGGGRLRVTGSVTNSAAFITTSGEVVVDGGSFNSSGGYRIASGTGVASSRTVLTNGATMAMTVSGAAIRVGDFAGAKGQLFVNNSTLTTAGSTFFIPFLASSTGEVRQSAGLVSGPVLNFCNGITSVGSYDMVGGTLEPLRIQKVSTGTATISFDGSTLRPISSTTFGANFFFGLDTAEIKSGGLTIDTPVDVTVGQVFSGAGALTKNGSSALTLTGTNSYLGTTVVNGGRLVFNNTAHTGGGSMAVADNAELGVRVVTAGTSLPASTLTLGGGSSSVLNIDFGSVGNPTVPVLNVNTLTANGSVTLNISGAPVTLGSVKLVDYTGSIGGGNFAAFSLGSLPNGVSAFLSNNVANSSIDLIVTSAGAYRWTGNINGVWDIGVTTNWIDEATGLPSTYSDGFTTKFLDGAATGNISLGALVSPTLVSISNNALAYAVTGPGGITTPTITKEGTNSFLLGTDAPNSIGVIEINRGAFVISNVVDDFFAAALTDISAGGGTFRKVDANLLTLTGNNSTFDGAIDLRAGMLRASANTVLGTTNGATTIASGATLDINNRNLGAEPIFVAGAGVGGAGAIVDSTTGTGVQEALLDVTMTGDAALGGNGRWDLRANGVAGYGPGLRGNGFKLTKVGTNLVSIAQALAGSPAWHLNLGVVEVNEGTLAFAQFLELGNPGAPIIVHDGARIQFFDLAFTNPLPRNVFLTNATLAGHGGANGTNVFTGTITVSGASFFEANAATTFLNGPVIGDGSVEKTLDGTFFFNGTNTYPGDTIVSAGFLGGTGRIAGNVNVTAGSLSPGVGIGTLTIGGSLTLGGGARFEINKSLSPANDLVVVTGAINAGGGLDVVNLGGAIVGGDTFRLFNKAVTGSFTNVNFPTPPAGSVWTNNLAVDGTIALIGSSVPQTPTNITFTVTGNTLNLMWPQSYIGYRLESQTNSINVGISNNWVTVAGSATTNRYDALINLNNGTVFFRLVYP